MGAAYNLNLCRVVSTSVRQTDRQTEYSLSGLESVLDSLILDIKADARPTERACKGNETATALVRRIDVLSLP